MLDHEIAPTSPDCDPSFSYTSRHCCALGLTYGLGQRAHAAVPLFTHVPRFASRMDTMHDLPPGLPVTTFHCNGDDRRTFRWSLKWCRTKPEYGHECCTTVTNLDVVSPATTPPEPQSTPIPTMRLLWRASPQCAQCDLEVSPNRLWLMPCAPCSPTLTPLLASIPKNEDLFIRSSCLHCPLATTVDNGGLDVLCGYQSALFAGVELAACAWTGTVRP